MEWKEMDDKRWELFLQILNKENLDLKGNSMGDYQPNFKSAYQKAFNIVNWYNGQDDTRYLNR